MKVDNASSGSSSVETSEAKPPPPNAAPEGLTEAEFLEQQAHNARLAMSRAWQEMKSRLGQGVDPKAWAAEYPWVTVSAAAVAGFVAAATLIPSKEEQALKRLAAIERALHPPPPPREDGNGDAKKEGRGGMLGTILHEAIAILRPTLLSMMTAGLAAGQVAPDGPAQPQQPGMPPEQQY